MGQTRPTAAIHARDNRTEKRYSDCTIQGIDFKTQTFRIRRFVKHPRLTPSLAVAQSLIKFYNPLNVPLRHARRNREFFHDNLGLVHGCDNLSYKIATAGVR